MKIKIIKARNIDYWYNKYIGEEFDVENNRATLSTM